MYQDAPGTLTIPVKWEVRSVQITVIGRRNVGGAATM